MGISSGMAQCVDPFPPITRRLSATSLPLADIAAEIGYSSESSFSRAFRRRFGMPPGEVRTSGG